MLSAETWNKDSTIESFQGFPWMKLIEEICTIKFCEKSKQKNTKSFIQAKLESQVCSP